MVERKDANAAEAAQRDAARRSLGQAVFSYPGKSPVPLQTKVAFWVHLFHLTLLVFMTKTKCLVRLRFRRVLTVGVAFDDQAIEAH